MKLSSGLDTVGLSHLIEHRLRLSLLCRRAALPWRWPLALTPRCRAVHGRFMENETVRARQELPPRHIHRARGQGTTERLLTDYLDRVSGVVPGSTSFPISKNSRLSTGEIAVLKQLAYRIAVPKNQNREIRSDPRSPPSRGVDLLQWRSANLSIPQAHNVQFSAPARLGGTRFESGQLDFGLSVAAHLRGPMAERSSSIEAVPRLSLAPSASRPSLSESMPDFGTTPVQSRRPIDWSLAEAGASNSFDPEASGEREGIARWVSKYLERQIARPKGGLTGIDPRVSIF